MAQTDNLLRILKDRALVGITAEEIRGREFIPQYNRVIKDLRREGHIIISWRRPEPKGIKALHRFYYCGQVSGSKMFWWNESRFYPEVLEFAIDAVRGVLREPEQMNLEMAL